MVLLQFQDLGIKLEDNSPEEIQDAVIDMVNIVENLKKDSKIEQEMQNKFRLLFDENYKKYRHIFQGRYWMEFKHHKIIRASYSTKFLEENKYWLN